MPQIEWPTRHVRAETLAKVSNTSYFFVKRADRNSLHLGAEVKVSGQTRYVQRGNVPADHRISTDEGGRHIVDPVPSDFTIDIPAAVIVRYPRRPMLRDPGAVALKSATNPLRVAAWTIAGPRFEGSIEIECAHDDDTPVVEAFVDSLADPAAWFELPLPGEHIGDSDVVEYDSSTGDIKLSALLSEKNLQGAFGRVGRRTCRVVSDVEATEVNRDYHTIRITPSDLVDGTTSSNAANVFASGATCRARAIDVSASDDTDFGPSWVIDWEETRGDV